MRSLLAAAVLGLLCSSCSFLNAANRPLMNLCEKRLVPDDPVAQILTAPLYVPACLAAGAIDTFIVHPIQVLDDAWYDAESAMWEPTGRGYVTECAALPFRVAFSTAIWSLSFSGRLVFDIPPWPMRPEAFARSIREDDAADRLLTLAPLNYQSYGEETAGTITKTMLDACLRYADDTELCEATIVRLPQPLTPEAVDYIAKMALTGKGHVCAAALWRLFADSRYQPPGMFSKDEKGNLVMGPKYREAEAHSRVITNRLASVYDGLVDAGHREAEVYLVYLASSKINQSGAQALALHILRSQARRGWPDYAAAVSFQAQDRLLSYVEACRPEAVADGWRALRVESTMWPKVVAEVLRRREKGEPSEVSDLEQNAAALIAQLQNTEPGKAADQFGLRREFFFLFTVMDAAQIAERLLTGSKADLELFKAQLHLFRVPEPGQQPSDPLRRLVQEKK